MDRGPDQQERVLRLRPWYSSNPEPDEILSKPRIPNSLTGRPMRTATRHSIRLSLLAVAGILLLSCSERDPTALQTPEETLESPDVSLTMAGRLDCTVDGSEGTMECVPWQPASPDGPQPVIHLGKTFVDLGQSRVFTVVDDGQDILVADEVALTNLSGQTIGVTADSRVWFFEGPTATTSGASVDVRNEDGEDTFTETSPRPYFIYADDLAPGDTSAARQWHFNVSSPDIQFTFSVYVEVALSDEDAPLIGSISPELLEPGDAATITGLNFSPTAENNDVTIDGVTATVTSATATELTVEVPALNPPDCTLRDAPLTVTVGSHPTASEAHPVFNRTAPVALAAMAQGDYVNLSDPAQVGCGFDLPVNAGEQYFISVHNVSTDRNTSVGYRLEGTFAPPAAPPSTVATLPNTTARIEPRSLDAADSEVSAFEAHIEALREGRRFARTAPLAPPRSVSAAAPPAVGDTLTFHAPNGDSIDAEVVYSPGSKVVVFEDVAAPQEDQMDAELIAMGEEYETRQEGILQTNFGDPQATDQDANGVIYIVFTPSTPSSLVRTCDFFPKTSCETSNEAEIAWIKAASSTEDPETYRRVTEPTIMHETKHVTSIGEDRARDQPLEEVALEEATAQLAQELWDRAVHGYSQFDNAQWEDGPGCFAPFGSSSCTEPVSGTQSLFAGLYDHLEAWEGETQFGSLGWYYLYWWFVRWAVDHSGTTESTLLKSLVQEGTLTGIDNLEDKVGRSFHEMLGEYTLATMTDDIGVTGFSPPSVITHPSWDSRDVFADLASISPNRSNPFPIIPTDAPFGSFTFDVTSVAAGSTVIFDLNDTGAGGGTQTVVPFAPGSSDPVNTLVRISVVRVQ